MDLRSCSPRVKRAKIIPPDSEEVERRLIQETIEEVSGFGPLQETENEDMDIDQEMKRRGIFVAGEGFADDPVKSSLHTNVSLHRYQPSAINLTPAQENISLPETRSAPIDINTIEGIEPFGEANLEQVAQIGMLEGVMGKKIYISYKNRQSEQPDSSIFTPSHDQGRISIQERISPKVLAAIINAGSVRNADSLIDLQTPRLATAPSFEVGGEQNDIQKEFNDPAPTSKSRSHISRRELFDQLAAEVECQNAQSKKARRRRRQKRSPSLTGNGDVVLKLNRPLIRHKRKQRVPKLRLPEVGITSIPNIFNDFDTYIDDNPDWAQTYSPKASIHVAKRRRASNTVEAVAPVEHVQQPQAMEECLNASPIEPQAPRNTSNQLVQARTSELVPQAQAIDIEESPQLEKEASVEFRDEIRRPYVPNSSAFLPKFSSTVANVGNELPRLTSNDIELAELRNSALPPVETVHVDKIVESMRHSRLLRTNKLPQASPHASAPEIEFRYVEGRYQLGTTSFVEFRRDNGKAERHSKYAMEVRSGQTTKL